MDGLGGGSAGALELEQNLGCFFDGLASLDSSCLFFLVSLGKVNRSAKLAITKRIKHIIQYAIRQEINANLYLLCETDMSR